MGRHHGGEERQVSAQARAERLLHEELGKRGWTCAELKERAKADVEKIKMARQLRQLTTMTWDWIAERWAMGSAGSAANCVRKN